MLNLENSTVSCFSAVIRNSVIETSQIAENITVSLKHNSKPNNISGFAADVIDSQVHNCDIALLVIVSQISGKLGGFAISLQNITINSTKI